MPEEPANSLILCVCCGLQIHDQYIYKVSDNLYWHQNCLKCTECGKLLGDSCYVKNFKPYCKDDYLKIFSINCSRCSLQINRQDMIIKCKTQIYHYDCFTCDICHKKFQPGDEYQFNLDRNTLVCKHDLLNCQHQQHDDSVSFNSPIESPPSPVAQSLKQQFQTYTDMMTRTAVSACNRFSSTYDYDFMANSDSRVYIDDYSCSYTKDDDDTEDSICSDKDVAINSMTGNQAKKFLKQHNSSSSSSTCSSSSKPTRIRTVLNEKQLHMLRACYLANPRPDSIMKEQLVEMTGLSSRVIRVWFQNKRCKDKKKTLLVRHHHHHNHHEQQQQMFESCF